ncbi:hypothetical protein EDD86DRAFT_275495 [Gorgonomyces haynaldii]|nr:hypothetical protein EDD86DRAFT_275495 [Gorgonomyces haynaldii]
MVERQEYPLYASRNMFPAYRDHMMTWYHSNLFDFAPKDLIQEYLMESMVIDRNRLKYDPWQGNTIVYDQFLYFPLEQMLKLVKCNLQMQVLSSMVFETPIKQIIKHQDTILVRTLGSVYLVDLDLEESQLLDSVEAMDVKSHTRWNRVCLGTRDKSIILFEDKKTVLRQPQTNCSTDDRDYYHQLEFGFHPEHLLIGERQKLCLWDLRQERDLLLYQTTDYIHSFDTREFHHLIANTDHILILDSRYLKTPILDLAYNDTAESQLTCKFLGDMFYTYGRRGEVCVYPLLNHDTISLSCKRPFLLDHFSVHESFTFHEPYHPHSLVPNLLHQSRYVEMKDWPPHTPLVSCLPIEESGNWSFFQLLEDGSMFKQSVGPHKIQFKQPPLKEKQIAQQTKKEWRDHELLDLSKIEFDPPDTRLETPDIPTDKITNLYRLLDPEQLEYPEPRQDGLLMFEHHLTDSLLQQELDLVKFVNIPDSTVDSDPEPVPEAPISRLYKRPRTEPVVLKTPLLDQPLRLGGVASDLYHQWQQEETLTQVIEPVFVKRRTRANDKPVVVQASQQMSQKTPKIERSDKTPKIERAEKTHKIEKSDKTDSKT